MNGVTSRGGSQATGNWANSVSASTRGVDHEFGRRAMGAARRLFRCGWIDGRSAIDWRKAGRRALTIKSDAKRREVYRSVADGSERPEIGGWARGADMLLQVRCAVYNGASGDGFGDASVRTSNTVQEITAVDCASHTVNTPV